MCLVVVARLSGTAIKRGTVCTLRHWCKLRQHHTDALLQLCLLHLHAFIAIYSIPMFYYHYAYVTAAAVRLSGNAIKRNTVCILHFSAIRARIRLARHPLDLSNGGTRPQVAAWATTLGLEEIAVRPSNGKNVCIF